MPAGKPLRIPESSAADSQLDDQMLAGALREERGHLLVTLRVSPRAAHDELVLEGGVLRVRVTAPPVEGAANAAVIALLARQLHLPKSRISLARGARGRDKQVAIEALTAAEFRARCGL